MSLPWNRSVRLRVGPHGAAATLERTWPRRAAMASAHRARADAEIAAGTDGSAFGLELGAIEPVLRELERAAPLRGARLNVELSDSVVHLDVVEGDFAGQSDPQLRAIAAACVAELLGDDADAYELRWQLQPDDRHLLICAIARAHLSALAQDAATLGLLLTSVQPDFVVQWNRHAGTLTSGTSVFAVTSGTALAIAWVVDGIISAISVAACANAASDDEPVDASSTGAEDDPALAAEQLDSNVGRLLLGLGLHGHARSGFSPTHPSPLDAVDDLDTRADRLLASIGQEPNAQTAFMLVAPDASVPAASRRWTVLGRDGAGS
ncbi:MAG: hypothetical protein ABI702_02055 [Burkholderiales bacterium]